ncbi:unnamed protein product, partial [Rotaria magnacalcarata]
PTTEPEEELSFMECSPTPPVSATPSQISVITPALSLPPPPPPPAPILFKLRDYFDSQPLPPTPTFYDTYSDEQFLQITR